MAPEGRRMPVHDTFVVARSMSAWPRMRGLRHRRLTVPQRIGGYPLVSCHRPAGCDLEDVLQKLT